MKRLHLTITESTMLSATLSAKSSAFCHKESEVHMKTKHKKNENVVQTAVQTAAEASDSFVEASTAEASAATTAEASAVAAAAAAARIEVFKNRRSFVFEMSQHNVFDKASLVEACDIFFSNYSNKSNRQAVSGCLYDMQHNYNTDIKTCQTDSRLVLKNYKAKKRIATL